VDRSIGSPRTRSVVGVRGPGISVFGLPQSGGHSILVLNERSVNDGGNLCPPWLVILKSV